MRRMLLFGVFLAGCASCAPKGDGQGEGGVTAAAAPGLPGESDDFVVFAPGAPVDEILPAVDRGLLSRGKAAKPGLEFEIGAGSVWFVVIRDGGRHGADFRPPGFHVVVGAGVRYPAGALLVRREWGTSGQVDGVNEQPESWGVAVVVEPGSERPYPAAVTAAVTTIVTALAQRVSLHPDCVLAMEEIAYTNKHESDLDERALATAARANLAAPPAPGRLTIQTRGGPRSVTFERRNTTPGIRVGMMMRRGFDGENRGMLFEYPHRATRNFWMRNCRIPIDLAYLKDGKIEQLHSMEPGFGRPQDELPYYSSSTPVRYALEMPAGWFARHDVKVGDSFKFE